MPKMMICANPAVSVPIRVPFNGPQISTARSGEWDTDAHSEHRDVHRFFLM